MERQPVGDTVRLSPVKGCNGATLPNHETGIFSLVDAAAET